ncbi:MAG TPA: hypothetical protein OIM42_04865 [Clostridiaceae bacterium]|nr:hypothetical protein [Clostridiaceae bacterium]
MRVGNSIEEDMKILEGMIENANIENMDMNDCFGGEHIEAIEHILSDYKRVLKENEEIKIKNNAIKRESEAYAEYMIRLDNELNLEKEKSKYEWIRQNCLSQELVNKLYIPIQEVKDKIEELKQEKKKYGNCLIEMYEDELVNRDIKILQELLEGRK